MFLASQRPRVWHLGPLCELVVQLQSLSTSLSSESYQVPLEANHFHEWFNTAAQPSEVLSEPTLISLSPKPSNEKDFLTTEIQFITITYGSQGVFLKPQFSGLPMQEATGLFFLYNGWAIRWTVALLHNSSWQENGSQNFFCFSWVPTNVMSK